jgi:hypothetical protein
MLVPPVLVVPPATMLAMWVLAQALVQLWLLPVAVAVGSQQRQRETGLPVVVLVVLPRLVALASQYQRQSAITVVPAMRLLRLAALGAAAEAKALSVGTRPLVSVALVVPVSPQTLRAQVFSMLAVVGVGNALELPLLAVLLLVVSVGLVLRQAATLSQTEARVVAVPEIRFQALLLAVTVLPVL